MDYSGSENNTLVGCDVEPDQAMQSLVDALDRLGHKAKACASLAASRLVLGLRHQESWCADVKKALSAVEDWIRSGEATDRERVLNTGLNLSCNRPAGEHLPLIFEYTSLTAYTPISSYRYVYYCLSQAAGEVPGGLSACRRAIQATLSEFDLAPLS